MASQQHTHLLACGVQHVCTAILKRDASHLMRGVYTLWCVKTAAAATAPPINWWFIVILRVRAIWVVFRFCRLPLALPPPTRGGAVQHTAPSPRRVNQDDLHVHATCCPRLIQLFVVQLPKLICFCFSAVPEKNHPDSDLPSRETRCAHVTRRSEWRLKCSAHESNFLIWALSQ